MNLVAMVEAYVGNERNINTRNESSCSRTSIESCLVGSKTFFINIARGEQYSWLFF